MKPGLLYGTMTRPPGVVPPVMEMPSDAPGQIAGGITDGQRIAGAGTDSAKKKIRLAA